MKKQSGFTLIEVMVAVGIFAIVGMASHAVLSSVLGANESSKEYSKRFGQLQRVMLKMERDFIQAVPRQVRTDGEAAADIVMMGERFLLDSEFDGVAFTRIGWRNPGMVMPRSDVQRVAYKVEEGVLQRQYFVYPDPASGEEPKTQELLDQVEGLTFQYHDGSEWKESWQAKKLPLAISVTLTLGDYGEIKRVFLMPGDQSQDSPFAPNGGSNGSKS